MKYLLILCSILFFLETHAQNKSDVFLNVGVEYRITPIYNGLPSIRLVDYNIDRGLSGNGVNYQLQGFIFKNWGFYIGQSIRYDHLFYEDTGTSVRRQVSALTTDFHSGFEKFFDLKNNNKIYLRLGVSLFNTHSDYVTEEQVFDDDNTLLFTKVNERNFVSIGNQIAVGYKTYYNLKLELGINSLSNDKYFFSEEGNIIVPYLKLSYDIFQFNK